MDGDVRESTAAEEGLRERKSSAPAVVMALMTAWLKGNSRINSGRRNERALRASKRRRRRRAMYINVSVSAAFSLFASSRGLRCRLISSSSAHVPPAPFSLWARPRDSEIHGLNPLRVARVRRRTLGRLIRRCCIRELRLTNLYRCRRGNRKRPLRCNDSPKGIPLRAGNDGKRADRFVGSCRSEVLVQEETLVEYLLSP